MIAWKEEVKEWKQTHKGESMDNSRRSPQTPERAKSADSEPRRRLIGKSPDRANVLAQVLGTDKEPKRPPGAYPMFIAEQRQMLIEKIVKEQQIDRRKAALMLYKEGKPFYAALPAAERRKYEDKATVAKAKFQEDTTAWKTDRMGEIARSSS